MGSPSPGGSGTLNIQPAVTVSAAQGMIFFPDGRLNLQGGTLDVSAISYHQGIQGNQFQWSSGTLHVGTFNGNLVNSSGTLAPGHSAGSTTINGSFTQQSGGKLEIEIGGPLAVSQFDFVNVAGTAALGGQLNLSLLGSYVPAPTDAFTILIAGNLQNSFANALNGQRVTTTDGLGSFLVHYGAGSAFDPHQIRLTNFQKGLICDLNGDGNVDAADAGVMFANWAGSGSGDLNADGIIDAADAGLMFSKWTGDTATAIPEPGTAILVLSCTVGVFLRQTAS